MTQARLVIGERYEGDPLKQEEVDSLGSRLGRNWFNGLMKRRVEDLKFRVPSQLEQSRITVKADDVRSFYASLGSLIEEYRIHPALLANVDETMLKTLRKWRKVVSRLEDPDPFIAEDEKVTHITLLPTVFANGDSLQSLVILPLVHIPNDLEDDLLGSFHWIGQSSGWINRETFHRFMREVYFPAIEERRLRYNLKDRWSLLLLDGHSSRENAELLEECLSHKIMIRTYVSHASHMCQVLDRGIFLEFKTDLTSRKSTAAYNNRVEWRNQTLRHAAKAMAVACEKMVVIKAWRESGCWPVDDKKALTKKNFPDLDLPPEESPLLEKRKRSGFRISNQLLTSQANIQALREQQANASSRKVRRKT